MNSIGHNIKVATSETIKEASILLRNGKLVVFPTETVYGLGGDATNEQAVATIFSVKKRPAFNPLIVHTHNIETARTISIFDDRAEKLAKAFWPGALTLVLPRQKYCKVSLLASAGLNTIAIRIPAHPIALKLIKESKCPIAAPSANHSSSISPTHAMHVISSLPNVDKGGPALVLDAGQCKIGIESTVIDLSSTQAALLRPGGIVTTDIEKVINKISLSQKFSSKPKAPGMLAKHYAPSIPLRMHASDKRPGELLLAFGPNAPNTASANLSATGNLIEAAGNLFAMLHALDDDKASGIAVMSIPNIGLGEAINDRLYRAASGFLPSSS